VISKRVRQSSQCQRYELFRAFYSASDYDASADHQHYRLRDSGLQAVACKRPAAVDYPVIQVSVTYPGASPETMANTCATPLEKQFLQIPGLEIATSTNQTGQSTLVLQFSLDKSLGDAATDVQAAISRAQGFLPTDLPQPPSFQKTNPNDQPIFYIALVSDTMTEGDLYDYGNTQLGQQIAIINGVSQVQVYGARSAIRIKVQVNQLASLGLTMTDVTNAVGQSTAIWALVSWTGRIALIFFFRTVSYRVLSNTKMSSSPGQTGNRFI